MPLPGKGLAAQLFHASAVLVLAGSLLTLLSRAGLLGIKESAKPPAVPVTKKTKSISNRVLTGGCLQHLVHECSQRLDLEGFRCEDHVGVHDDSRVPHGTNQPFCGFEALSTEALATLISKYSFRFIGGSTTRRLTKSFASVVAGNDNPLYPLAHTPRLDLSRGDLKVTFDWAPTCSGPSGLGEMLTTVMAEENQDKDKKRTVIITSFGIHDASSQLQISQKKGLESFDAATLATCRNATAQLAHNAEAGDSLFAPLVFLLQNNGVKLGGVGQLFLDELHRIQREELGFEATIEVDPFENGQEAERRGAQSDGGDGISMNGFGVVGDNHVVSGKSICDGGRHGAFLVEDGRSKLHCNKKNTLSHFREHAKVAEGKMLWDLIALVDRELSPSPVPVKAKRNESLEAVKPSWVAENGDASGALILGAEAVWSRLQEAAASQDECVSPPCGKGKHMHKEWADFGEEMSHVQGAVVVRRPDLIEFPGMLAPANSLDFVQTLQSYFTIFKDSLFPSRMMIDGYDLPQVQMVRRFVDAVVNENSSAARHLSTYYAEDTEVPKLKREGYENTPTLVGMSNVFINKRGYVWNKKDYVVPKSCKTEKFGSSARNVLSSRRPTSYEKVFVMNQHWGDAYFHFVVENLARITFMLDILRANSDIKIALFAPTPADNYRKKYMEEFLELIGMDLSRVIYIDKEIHADLAVLPSSTACGKPDTEMINMLRNVLLQAVYPGSGGVPPPVARPVLVLVVRETKRRLLNNNQVRDALKQEFPGFDVVEFLGTGPTLAQLKTFATASLIVAPHGAGLSNMVVSPLHTPVLEIGPLRCSPCYVQLAVKLQHIYARHPAGNAWDTQCDTEYEPNVDEILRLARDLLEAKRQADSTDPPRTRNT